MRAVMSKVEQRAPQACAASLTVKQVALGVCVAPLAISTAFTGVLFYDGKSAADVQVKPRTS
jgi:hypothetical protein